MLNQKRTKAQSIIEYAALVVIVSVAIGTMLLTIQRAANVRVRHLNQELNESHR